ncbi:MAG: hypothetical protein C0599_00120 [Salinivirgaceae bacterium]|nr:MAG: hypothetical protein C0599_00120 [Salinivirgaceae bacterium]
MKVQVEHKVALLYLFIGAVWILFSDGIVNMLVDDTEAIRSLQTMKGWAFVGVSALLLFFYIRRNTIKNRQIADDLFLSREKYLSLYQKAPVAFYTLNEQGVIEDVNPEWLRILKFSFEEVIGKPFSVFVHPDFLSHFENNFELVKQNGQISDLRLRLRKKNLDYIIVAIEGMVNKTDDGKISTFCAMKDITAENEAKVQLVERESRYRSMFHKNMSVMLIVEPDGQIAESNNAAQRFYGYDHQELQSLSLKAILNTLDDSYTELLLKMKSENQFVAEQQHKLQNADVRDVLVYASRIIYKSDYAYYLIIHDITPQKNAEKELKSAKEKAEESNNLIKSFLNNISHELRTPMNSIMGFSQMLIRPNKAEEKKKKYIHHINESCYLLLDKITDTIDVSRIGTSYSDSFIDSFDLSLLIKEVVAPFRKKAKDRQNKIIVLDQLSDAYRFISTDKYKIRRIVKHLLNNACKNTEKGIVQLKVFYDNLRSRYLIEVLDSGIGIETKLQTKVFEPFVQVHNSSTELESGNGLGLTIVKSFAEQMGGEVYLKSTPQKGTVVTVLLPTQNNN